MQGSYGPNGAHCPPQRNKNKSSSCQDNCFRVCRWFPPAFITSIVFWSYFAYVIELCFSFIDSTVTIIFYLIFYHIFFIAFVFVYYRVIFSEPGSVPDEFYPPADIIINYFSESDVSTRKKILADYAKSLPVIQRNTDGSIRFCDKCACLKPDRAHHCGVIGQCVLKMDHFCPWVNNTVGFANYKLFVLFLLYAVVYCLYVAMTAAPFFVEIWTIRQLLREELFTGQISTGRDNSSTYDETTSNGDDVSSVVKFNVLFVFFVALMFALSVFALLGYHIYLTLTNQSTIESFHPPFFQSGPDRKAYRVSMAENWRQVFGNNPRLWFLPVVSSTIDGITYPCRFRAQTSDRDPEAGASVRLQQSENVNVTSDLVTLADSNSTSAFTPIVTVSASGSYGSAAYNSKH